MVVEKGQLDALKIDRRGDEKPVRAWPWFLGLGLVVVVIACLVWFLVRSVWVAALGSCRPVAPVAGASVVRR